MTPDEARKTFSYDPDTGELTWKTAQPHLVGKLAGSKGNAGYIRVIHKGKSYKAHRIAWAIVHGKWPSRYLDHANGIRSDNRLFNLREAEPWQNNGNKSMRSDNTTGLKGVSFITSRDRYAAQISLPGTNPRRNKFLGYYETAEEAHEVYCLAADLVFKEFARHA